MSLAGHVTRMGKGQEHTGFWWGYLRERVHFENPGVDGGYIKLDFQEVV